MISQKAIQQFSDKYQTSELNVRREYFQHLFLSLFYQQEKMDDVYFKGGTALRLLYNSPRFSEDLDFDSPTGDVHAIEDAVITTLTKAQQDGIQTELDEAKETSGGYLSVMRFIADDETVPIRIEISFREKTKQGTAFVVTSELFPDYTIMQLEQEQLVSGKIAALLSRKKPRDFYDFYFLMRRNLLPEKNKGAVLREVLESLKKTDINFDRELKEFLPKSHHMIVKDFKTTLEREVRKYI